MRVRVRVLELVPATLFIVWVAHRSRVSHGLILMRALRYESKLQLKGDMDHPRFSDGARSPSKSGLGAKMF